jgi:adenylate kinase
MVIILLGPPGVGKGTQGELLAETLEWDRLVTGDLLRAARRDGTETGNRAKAYMDRGDLVPDEVIVALVKERISSLPDDQEIIFDGFPRTVPQAEALDEVLPESGRAIDAVVLLEAPDEVLVKRIGGRRSCSSCGRIYNVHFDPPEAGDTCDECGSELLHRSDDDPDTVRHRLEVYRAQTEPLVQYYESGDAEVLRIDGNREPGEVQASIRSALASHLGIKD